MIDLYYWPTRNGHKILMFLEEAGLPYQIRSVNIQKGEQFAPEFLEIAPNNKIPAIVDSQPIVGDSPVSLFESGAILLYLAEKTGRLLPQAAARIEALQWLFWQIGGIGPIGGQAMLFKLVLERMPAAIEHFSKELKRLMGVLDRRLDGRPFLAGGDYSIADIATFPWAAAYDFFELNLDTTPNVAAWLRRIADRPATLRSYRTGALLHPGMHVPTILCDALAKDNV